MATLTKMSDLHDAVDWLSQSVEFESRATISRATGAIYWISDLIDNEDIPDDIDNPELYVDVPSKKELDLGRHLVMRFVDEHLPQSYDVVARYFSKAGAYARFKDLLDRHAKLDAWYKYEQDATERALREWAGQNDLQIAPDGDAARGENILR